MSLRHYQFCICGTTLSLICWIYKISVMKTLLSPQTLLKEKERKLSLIVYKMFYYIYTMIE